ncbi:ETS homologous factor-like [Arctopsyche grandis]|uniref:ETS homologous factor-like n=1 Tax=Arctopsyche grandis TaxID=121162 RepID=UPI00406D73A5
MMLFNPLLSPNYSFDAPKDYHGEDDFCMMFKPSFDEATILPNVDQYPASLTNDFMTQAVTFTRIDEICTSDLAMSYEDSVYPQGDKHLTRMFTVHDSAFHTSEWKTKHVHNWNGADIKNWIIETATNKGYAVAEIASFGFSNVTGVELSKMTVQTFCERMHSQANHLESTIIGEYLHAELKMLLAETQSDQDSVVPVTIVDRYSHEEDLHSSRHLTDLDNYYYKEISDNHSEMYPRNLAQSDSGYDSVAEEYEPKMEECGMIENDYDIGMMEQTLPLVVTKRPPGRPKGSGKKHPKRVKNVSVPEFLRDLLLNPNYCPRIIKWEDYSAGKFRFVRADEVAKLWGVKKSNEKMSFEKFSRAMRYHYKQGVLVSVPTARLVYQFGPKAPSYKTLNPNFESDISKLNMR